MLARAFCRCFRSILKLLAFNDSVIVFFFNQTIFFKVVVAQKIVNDKLRLSPFFLFLKKRSFAFFSKFIIVSSATNVAIKPI